MVSWQPPEPETGPGAGGARRGRQSSLVLQRVVLWRCAMMRSSGDAHRAPVAETLPGLVAQDHEKIE